MTPQSWTRALVAVACLSGLPLAACHELFPQRSEGEKLYRKRCAKCHGVDGSGNTPRYLGDAKADLLDDSWEHGGEDGAMAYVIKNGVAGRMPDNQDLTQEQIREIVGHIRDLRVQGTGSR